MGGGRKFGEAYKLYEFYPKVIDRKYVAVCRYCNKHMQNTTGARLRQHRNVCKVSNKSMGNGRLASTSKALGNKEDVLPSEPKVEVTSLKAELDEPMTHIDSPAENQNYMPPSPELIDEQLYEKQIEYIQDYLKNDNPLSHEETEVRGPLAHDDNDATRRSSAHARKIKGLEEQKMKAEIQYLRTKTA